jgi:hypothetical protein
MLPISVVIETPRHTEEIRHRVGDDISGRFCRIRESRSPRGEEIRSKQDAHKASRGKQQKKRRADAAEKAPKS